MEPTNIAELIENHLAAVAAEKNIADENTLRINRLRNNMRAWESLYRTKTAMYDALERKLFRVQAENANLRAENDKLAEKLYYLGGE